MRDDLKAAIRDHITVPDHISAMAAACAFDLMNGPSVSQKPASGNWEDFTEDDFAMWADDFDGETVPTYTGAPGAMLREFILTLPSDLYVYQDSGCVQDEQPEGWFDEDIDLAEGEEAPWVEPEPYFVADHQAIIEALFGRTIAKEFY